MSELKIYKASAGSGKTFKLTEEYLLLLFQHPLKYRKILAVTFTNKATDEMKSRIIQELYKLASGKASDYINTLSVFLSLPEEKIREKAKEIIKRVLHDYSRFSIHTIDSFFQQVLRSFVRELGLQVGFNLELNVKKILSKAIEELLSDADDNKGLLSLMESFVHHKIENASSWNPKNDLEKLGNELFSESVKASLPLMQNKISDKKFMTNYRKNLMKVIEEFENQMLEIGKRGNLLISQHGLDRKDFYQGNTGPANYFNKIIRKNEDDYSPNSYVNKVLSGEANMVSKSSERKAAAESISGELIQILQEAISIYESEFCLYLSCKLALRNIFTLSVLNDISLKISEVAKEENIFLITDVALFIKELIQDNDAPFIYEKTGTAYKHFMIDEFQDTSSFQWGNFKPLILNSLSEGNSNLVVGDVKQSIYRWRNSDWRLLGEKIYSEIPGFPIKDEFLETNWRSTINIVNFNNAVFTLVPKVFQDILNSKGVINPEMQKTIVEAYSNSSQKIPDTQKVNGFVNLKFIAGDDKKNREDQILQKLLEDIKKLLDLGHRPGSIAILVRNHKSASLITKFFIEYQAANSDFQLDLLSDESLYLSSSKTVQVIIEALQYLVYPNDRLNLSSLVFKYRTYFSTSDTSISVEDLFAPANADLLPSKFMTLKGNMSGLSFFELVSKIVNIFGLDKNTDESSYLLSFQDLVLEYSRAKSVGPRNFLDYWNDEGINKTIVGSPEQNAVRILTIHKSKGLEFENVLIPFCNWDLDENQTNSMLWCKPYTAPLNELELLPLSYSSKLERTIFHKYYLEEKAQAFMDSLNLLYVAFTRARTNLFVYASAKSTKGDAANVGQLLFDCFYAEKILLENGLWNSESNCFSLGELANSTETKTKGVEIVAKAGINENVREKISVKFNSESFFSMEAQQALDYGSLIHEILAEIRYADDRQTIINKFFRDGKLTFEEKTYLENKISSILNNSTIANWFSKDWNVLNETSILLENGKSKRPDRIMIKDGENIVVDYKVSDDELPAYHKQVKEYMEILHKINGNKTRGYLLFIPKEKVVEVE